ncbi:Tll0287-like domain-containing protein [Nonlabens agnitus]|uniref:Cytochrome c family protein n=1 Tax=Nonlabens agnitus TaxID=870484 RepID=A0A2S9WR09_9FLAO|nr:DUF3365 domain-containing protein [Nonlabens agnitus]PRP65922.1 cytochrome c family protein [Nonlabens agnitus]
MKYFIILFSLILLNSCHQKQKSSYQSLTTVDTNKGPVNDGKLLMEQKCYSCHNSSTDHKERIASPMVAIKSHYLNDSTTKEQFANAIWNFVQQPSQEKSKMKGAIRRFGLMPYQSFEENEIRAIANYMYDYKVDEPEWFKEHLKDGKGKMNYHNDGIKVGAINRDQKKTPTEKGMEYALNTKKELGKNLMGTIQKKGTLEAVLFCNARAYPLTDSMATAQNARIRRVSDKARNPQNAANDKELKVIEQFKKAVANGEDYLPITKLENGRHVFYYPIITNSMCLQCHGSPNKTINPEVIATIRNLYPNDKAMGYDINEVRGIWAIDFDNTNAK